MHILFDEAGKLMTGRLMSEAESSLQVEAREGDGGIAIRVMGEIQLEVLREVRATEVVDETPRVIIRPTPVDDAGFTITPRKGPDGAFFQVRGTKPERWVNQTDFTNEEAIGYLADRLNAIGIEDELFKLGAHPGDTVVIGPEEGGVVFDWEPTMMTGAELLGPRGSDARFEGNERRTTGERRREYRERMDAKAEARSELWSERESGHWTDPGEDE